MPTTETNHLGASKPLGLGLGLAAVVALVAGLAVMTSACSHRHAWKHKTLKGAEADKQFAVDDETCENATPASLSAGIYADHHSFFIYESQGGRTTGATQSQGIARRHEGMTGPTSTPTAGSEAQARTALSKAERGVNLSLYDRCMGAHGWTQKR